MVFFGFNRISLMHARLLGMPEGTLRKGYFFVTLTFLVLSRW